ncbi:hypothetical protein MTR_7g074160 [Medicago truncatula]|uniref:Uncharacterized protein n=1 Tax=Medicago truncatula TaxID=3880 RepID=G7KY90_MEDTR|nr:hypothetical protein MTR_7g074160 [Medicago truncatula]
MSFFGLGLSKVNQKAKQNNYILKRWHRIASFNGKGISKVSLGKKLISKNRSQ